MDKEEQETKNQIVKLRNQRIPDISSHRIKTMTFNQSSRQPHQGNQPNPSHDNTVCGDMKLFEQPPLQEKPLDKDEKASLVPLTWLELKQILCWSGVIIFIIGILTTATLLSLFLLQKPSVIANHRISYPYSNSHDEFKTILWSLNDTHLIGQPTAIQGHVMAVSPRLTRLMLQNQGNLQNQGRLLTETQQNRPTGVFVQQKHGVATKHMNEENIHAQFDLHKIFSEFQRRYPTETKKILAKIDLETKKEEEHHTEPSQEEVSHVLHPLHETYAESVGRDRETTHIKHVKTHRGTQVNGQFQLDSESDKHGKSSKLLHALLKSNLNVKEKQRIYKEVIDKVVKPLLNKHIQNIQRYGKELAKRLGISFEKSQHLLLYYQRQHTLPEESHSNKNTIVISNEYEPAHVKQSDHPTKTTFLSKRAYQTLKNCTHEENSKICNHEEWLAEDTPFKIRHKSQQHKKVYKTYHKYRAEFTRGPTSQQSEKSTSNANQGSGAGSSSSTSANQGNGAQSSTTSTSQGNGNSGLSSNQISAPNADLTGTGANND